MKKLVFLSFTIILCVSLPRYSFAQLDLLDEAFLFYPFDGNCEDISGNNYHATGQNLMSDTGYTGIPNSCFRHNGTSSMISRPFLNLEDTIALAGWFYSTSDFQNSSLIYNGNSGMNGYGLFMKQPFTTFGLGRKIVVVQGGISENIVDTSFNMPKNQWVHLALVIRNTYFELYINGLFRGSGVRPFNPPSSSFSIGMNPEQQAGGFPAFSGKIDDVVAYKRNVDAQFIGRIFNEGFLTHNNLISGREDVLVFPNPSSGNFNIKGNNISDVQIFNALGHEVSKAFRIRNGSGSVSIENGNAAIGTYFVHFLSDKYKKTKVIQIN
jgi:hypothetical protein